MIYAIEFLAPVALSAQLAPDEATMPTLCESSESTILYGQVQDSLGLDVAVCLSREAEEQRLTIRWVGEGGGSDISCICGDCDGRIEYSRYTSPHQTILTLAWREGDHVQRLTQTLSRPDLESEAQGQTRHSWRTADMTPAESLEYPVVTGADPLALMALETILEKKGWTAALLAGGAQ